MAIIVGIKFRNTNKVYYFDPKDLAFEEGDGVTLVLADGRADARITKNRPKYQNGRENG